MSESWEDKYYKVTNKLTKERDEARGMYKSCMDRGDWKERATELRSSLTQAMAVVDAAKDEVGTSDCYIWDKGTCDLHPEEDRCHWCVLRDALTAMGGKEGE